MIHERDRQTDGQTPHADISRAYASHRATTRMVWLPDGEKKFEFLRSICRRFTAQGRGSFWTERPIALEVVY